MFDGINCWKKFIIFSALLTIILSVIIYFIAEIGIPLAILSIALLSILLKILVDNFGDIMLTDTKFYMSSSDIKEFEKKEVDPSLFTNSY